VFDPLGQSRTVGREGEVVRIPVGTGPGGGGLFVGAGRSFPETNQAIRGPFLARWEQKGGPAIYGFPIGPQVIEVPEDGKPYLVQYFERARFEPHPENAATNQILLAQSGRAGDDSKARERRTV